jgi:leucine dehydrogenase
MRLAEGMTHKWAAAGLDGGGGKAVIDVPPDLTPDAREDLLRRYGALVQKHRGLFLTGPDLGTTSEDMDIIGENAPSYVFGRTLGAGGGGNPAPYTALGVFTAMKVAAGRAFPDGKLAGKRVLIQGVGSVGRELIPMLRDAGARLLFTDVRKEVFDAYRGDSDMTYVNTEAEYDTPCEIFAPCAVGGVLNADTIPRLQCQAVVGAANNQLGDPQDAARLKARRILYAPDFVGNAGGAIGLIGIETKHWSPEEARKNLVQAITGNLGKIFDLAEREGITTDEAAKRLTEARLAAI